SRVKLGLFDLRNISWAVPDMSEVRCAVPCTPSTESRPTSPLLSAPRVWASRTNSPLLVSAQATPPVPKPLKSKVIGSALALVAYGAAASNAAACLHENAIESPVD